jgi:hypothetical protein
MYLHRVLLCILLFHQNAQKIMAKLVTYFPAPPPPLKTLCFRVARWYIFSPKIAIWVNFGGSCNRICWHILWPFGLFYAHLVYIMVIWSILWPFDIFYGHLVHFVVIWYIFPHFGILNQEKFSNPASLMNGYFKLISHIHVVLTRSKFRKIGRTNYVPPAPTFCF